MAEIVSASHPVCFKLREEERTRLREVANAAGIGPSSFAAEAVRAAIGTARRRPLSRRLDALGISVREATSQLCRIGNNVNQIARYAHSGGRVDADALAAVRDELAAIDASLALLMR